MNTPTCPPCTGECAQGENCPGEPDDFSLARGIVFSVCIVLACATAVLVAVGLAMGVAS